MIRTIASIFITLALLIGVSVFEIFYVTHTFDYFNATLESLHQKTKEQTATYEDGVAIQTYWRNKKKTLHIWLPHNALQEIDYQLDEAVGCIYLKDYQNALPKVEILLGLSENIPLSYSLKMQNIF